MTNDARPMPNDQRPTSAPRASAGEPTPPVRAARFGGPAKRVFVQILLLEAAIVAGLWWFGRAYEP